jgi:hypothetical protein
MIRTLLLDGDLARISKPRRRMKASGTPSDVIAFASESGCLRSGRAHLDADARQHPDRDASICDWMAASPDR